MYVSMRAKRVSLGRAHSGSGLATPTPGTSKTSFYSLCSWAVSQPPGWRAKRTNSVGWFFPLSLPTLPQGCSAGRGRGSPTEGAQGVKKSAN